MKNILIAGGSGFIGKYLAQRLTDEGFRVSILTRQKKKKPAGNTYFWNPLQGLIDPESLKNQHIIINLSGVSIGDRLWTRKRKEAILNSRVQSTRLLAKSIIKEKIVPELFINISAIGYYGHRPGEILTEQARRGTGFLSRVCYEWERSVKSLSDTGIPYAIIRLGIVLGNGEGFLQKTLLPFKFGLNPVFSTGAQPVPWIHIEDVFRIMYQLTEGKLPPGIYNGVAPDVISQVDFNQTLMKVKKLKALPIHIPEKLLQILIGEMANLFTCHQMVKPQKLLEQQFQYKFWELSEALSVLFDKNHLNKR